MRNESNGQSNAVKVDQLNHNETAVKLLAFIICTFQKIEVFNFFWKKGRVTRSESVT